MLYEVITKGYRRTMRVVAVHARDCRSAAGTAVLPGPRDDVSPLVRADVSVGGERLCDRVLGVDVVVRRVELAEGGRPVVSPLGGDVVIVRNNFV